MNFIKDILNKLSNALSNLGGTQEISYDFKKGTKTTVKVPGTVFNRDVLPIPIEEPLPGRVMPPKTPVQIIPRVKAGEELKQRIEVPSYKPGGKEVLPQKIAQVLMSVFDASKEATTAATALHHPKQQTYTPQEIARFGNESWNHGENPDYITQKSPYDYNTDKYGKPYMIVNPKGQEEPSEDRGLFRINNATFYGLQKRKGRLLKELGIDSYQDMYDPLKNAMVAKIIKDEGGWSRWFAAPLSLRQNEKSNQ